MTDPFEATSAAAAAPHPDSDPQFDVLRAILLDEERQRIRQLEQETAALRQKDQQQTAALAAEVQALQAEIEVLRQANQQQAEYAAVLRTELTRLQEQLHTESHSLVPKIIQQMGFISANTIREKRQELRRSRSRCNADPPNEQKSCERYQLTEKKAERDGRAHDSNRLMLVCECQRWATDSGCRLGDPRDHASSDKSPGPRREGGGSHRR